MRTAHTSYGQRQSLLEVENSWDFTFSRFLGFCLVWSKTGETEDRLYVHSSTCKETRCLLKVGVSAAVTFHENSRGKIQI